MENKYIDQFFKNKLEHREVPFSEDAWLAAEQMIVEQERKKRWGGLGRLWLLLPFLIAGFIVLVYQSQSVDFPTSQNSMTTTPLGLPNLGDKKAASFEQELKTAEPESTSAASNNTFTNQPSTSASEGTSVVVAGTATLEEEQSKEEINTAVKTINDFDESKTPSTKSNTPKEKTQKKKVAPPMASLQKSSVPQTNSNSSDLMLDKNQGDLVISKENNLALNETVMLPSDKEEHFYEMSELEPVLISSTDYQLPSNEQTVINKTIRYHKINRLKAGLMTSTIFTPSFNDKIIGISGMNIGGTFSYRLNARWSANADLLYEYHGRNFAFPNGNNSLQIEYQTYGFGLDDKRLNVKVKQSHLVTLPLYVKYHIGHHSLDLGMQLAYTLGLRGKIEEETISENQVASTRQSKNSWIDSDEVTPYQFNMMLGYQYKISHRWSIGLRSVIVPSRLPRHGRDSDEAFNPLEELGLIGEQNASGERTPIPLFAHNAINFHLGVQYNLNPKVRYITKPLMGL